MKILLVLPSVLIPLLALIGVLWLLRLFYSLDHKPKYVARHKKVRGNTPR